MCSRSYYRAVRCAALFFLTALSLLRALFGGAPVWAAGDEPTTPPPQTNFEFHNRDNQQPLPLISMTSRTHITGPVAVTNIEFVAKNDNANPIETAVTFEVPTGTVLTRFGYFYGSRFIPGKMYDKDEAWKIYSAVTSRGRDPGIMDRPTETNYHAQIFPVAPKQPLRVRITLVQMLQTRDKAMEFQLPLVQGGAYLNGWNQTPFRVDARVSVLTNRPDAAVTARGESQIGPLTPTTEGKNRVMRFVRTFIPRENLTVRVPFENERDGNVHYSGYSCMVGPHEGYYAVTVAAPHSLRGVRARTESDGITGMALPTAFGDTAPYSDIHLVGRYTEPGMARVRFRSAGGTTLSVPLYLSSNRTPTVTDNPAGAIWADKRIAVLQQATRRNFKNDIVRLSRRFMVVSNFTALLAIPQEELDYYRKVLAKRQVQTNTNTTGGGGGDPYISVHAPEDASQVVALFPDGDVKNLIWNAQKKVWEGRFDIPFGTPEGAYRVTLIVVHQNGQRTQLMLSYQNRLTGPQISPNGLQTLLAERGQPVTVSVQGQNIERATVVAPWGARLSLSDKGQGTWQTDLPVPQDQPTGPATLTLILLDGAHNRTTVTLDMEVR